MQYTICRRQFISTALAATAGMAWGLQSTVHAQSADSPYKTKLLKALIVDKPSRETMLKMKEAGYDGIEGGVIPEADAEKCRALAQEVGLNIHSVLRGWAEFNSSDASKVEATFKKTEEGILAAKGFGANAVLLVPCRIGGMKTPKPREFKIEFDEKNNHISKVVAGDNAPYADYIKAHNHAADTSREAIMRLIPIAEKAKVVIALENVWNNLWVQPAIFKNFVASFNSPWVKAYFDIGNHVKYAPSEEWILTLGNLIAKCHAKDFKLNEDPGGNGSFVAIRDGSVNWPKVRAALETTGYSGFLTIEGGGLSMSEGAKRLDLIFAGK